MRPTGQTTFPLKASLSDRKASRENTSQTVQGDQVRMLKMCAFEHAWKTTPKHRTRESLEINNPPGMFSAQIPQALPLPLQALHPLDPVAAATAALRDIARNHPNSRTALAVHIHSPATAAPIVLAPVGGLLHQVRNHRVLWLCPTSTCTVHSHNLRAFGLHTTTASFLHRTVNIHRRMVSIHPKMVNIHHRTVSSLPRTVNIHHRTVSFLPRRATIRLLGLSGWLRQARTACHLQATGQASSRSLAFKGPLEARQDPTTKQAVTTITTTPARNEMAQEASRQRERRRRSPRLKGSSGAYSGREQWQVSWIFWVVSMQYKQWKRGNRNSSAWMNDVLLTIALTSDECYG